MMYVFSRCGTFPSVGRSSSAGGTESTAAAFCMPTNERRAIATAFSANDDGRDGVLSTIVGRFETEFYKTMEI